MGLDCRSTAHVIRQMMVESGHHTSQPSLIIIMLFRLLEYGIYAHDISEYRQSFGTVCWQPALNSLVGVALPIHTHCSDLARRMIDRSPGVSLQSASSQRDFVL